MHYGNFGYVVKSDTFEVILIEVDGMEKDRNLVEMVVDILNKEFVFLNDMIRFNRLEKENTDPTEGLGFRLSVVKYIREVITLIDEEELLQALENQPLQTPLDITAKDHTGKSFNLSFIAVPLIYPELYDWAISVSKPEDLVDIIPNESYLEYRKDDQLSKVFTITMKLSGNSDYDYVCSLIINRNPVYLKDIINYLKPWLVFKRVWFQLEGNSFKTFIEHCLLKIKADPYNQLMNTNDLVIVDNDGKCIMHISIKEEDPPVGFFEFNEEVFKKSIIKVVK